MRGMHSRNLSLRSFCCFSDSKIGQSFIGSRLQDQCGKKSRAHLWWWRIWNCGGNLGAGGLLGGCTWRRHHPGVKRAPRERWYVFLPPKHRKFSNSYLSTDLANIILDASAPLHHAHIHFGHCFKRQENWNLYLERFVRGGGTLYDLEFLTDASGKRVAAFGYHAGYAGAAIALLAWAHQLAHPDIPLPAIPNFQSQSAVLDGVTSKLMSSIDIYNNGQPPCVIVIGALGRCGSGAVDFCLAAGVPSSCILEWDKAETARGGPFSRIASADIFINCVYSDKEIPPFVTYESLSIPGRRLRVACDVSCDPNGPYNPVPIYHEITTFLKPTVPVEVGCNGPKMTMVSIDHLPSLVAREASDAFAEQLLPSLKKLNQRYEDGVWLRAEKLFTEKVAELAELTELPEEHHTSSFFLNWEQIWSDMYVGYWACRLIIWAKIERSKFSCLVILLLVYSWLDAI